MDRILLGVIAGALLGAAPVAAAEGCPAGHVCASAPRTVVAALQAQGYKAQLSENGQTNAPIVSSAANGYNFAVHFFGCEGGEKCSSLSFVTVFENDGSNTPELANLWNKENRFSQMAVNDNGSLAFTYDVTTVGGLNQANFADVIDWWQTMLGLVGKFFKEHPAK
jgi:hypothetical protein